MSNEEALIYVDLIVENLHDWGIIPESKYGHMTEHERQKLAEMLAEKSEE